MTYCRYPSTDRALRQLDRHAPAHSPTPLQTQTRGARQWPKASMQNLADALYAAQPLIWVTSAKPTVQVHITPGRTPAAAYEAGRASGFADGARQGRRPMG